jgi:AcrR family transcriptional regulator
MLPATQLKDPPATQRADARRNHKRIIEAARDLFAEHGYDAQMDHIARRADVGVGTVYRHFPQKEDLLAALIDARFDGLADAAREALSEPDPWTGFEKLMHYSAGVMAADRALSQAMGDRQEMMQAAANRVGLPELTDQVVRRAKESGDLRSDITWEDVPGLTCGMGRAMHEGVIGPLAMSWPRYLAIILDGLRAPGTGPLPD